MAETPGIDAKDQQRQDILDIVPLDNLVLQWKPLPASSHAGGKQRWFARSRSNRVSEAPPPLPGTAARDFDALRDQLVQYAGSIPVLSERTLISVVIRAMELIETIVELQGKSKRDWVLAAVDYTLKVATNISDADRVLLMQTLRITIPKIIDEMINAAQQVYAFGKKVADSKCCQCFPTVSVSK
jgi:hypothetical protein